MEGVKNLGGQKLPELLIFSGVNCCDAWERTHKWSASEKFVAQETVRDQIRILRSHPSSLTWVNGSDDASSSEVDHMYREVLKSEH